ncbi:hypothetical protein ABKN59_010653 [Abortiporus biennis]
MFSESSTSTLDVKPEYPSQKEPPSLSLNTAVTASSVGQTSLIPTHSRTSSDLSNTGSPTVTSSHVALPYLSNSFTPTYIGYQTDNSVVPYRSWSTYSRSHSTSPESPELVVPVMPHTPLMDQKFVTFTRRHTSSSARSTGGTFSPRSLRSISTGLYSRISTPASAAALSDPQLCSQLRFQIPSLSGDGSVLEHTNDHDLLPPPAERAISPPSLTKSPTTLDKPPVQLSPSQIPIPNSPPNPTSPSTQPYSPHVKFANAETPTHSEKTRSYSPGGVVLSPTPLASVATMNHQFANLTDSLYPNGLKTKGSGDNQTSSILQDVYFEMSPAQSRPVPSQSIMTTLPQRLLSPSLRDSIPISSTSPLTNGNSLPNSTIPDGKHIRKHPKFFIQEEMVSIQVEESLYRVHRSHLERNSDYFRQYLLKNGTDSCNPIMIPGVSQQDFDILLQFLYEDIFDMESISIDAWFVLLSISATLHFRKIHQLAIQYITPHLPELDPVDIIPMDDLKR